VTHDTGELGYCLQDDSENLSKAILTVRKFSFHRLKK
jgi:hypothetical protein